MGKAYRLFDGVGRAKEKFTKGGECMNNDLKEVLENLIAAARIPVEIDIWTAKEVAALLKCSSRQVLERYASKPDFPKPIRLPSETGRGYPRWYAREIILWADKYKVAA